MVASYYLKVVEVVLLYSTYSTFRTIVVLQVLTRIVDCTITFRSESDMVISESLIIVNRILIL